MANDQYGSWHADNEFQPNAGSGVVNVGQGERIGSAAVGAWLLSSGLNNLFKNPVKGLVNTALGGYLLYRGISGHCALYSSMGKTKGVSNTSAINIRTGLIVNKPKDEVYAFWRKLENLPLFMHVCELFSSDWGIGITGYASKVPESGHKIFAYYAIIHKTQLKKSGRIVPNPEEPPEVQRKYVNDVIRTFAQLLK